MCVAAAQVEHTKRRHNHGLNNWVALRPMGVRQKNNQAHYSLSMLLMHSSAGYLVLFIVDSMLRCIELFA